MRPQGESCIVFVKPLILIEHQLYRLGLGAGVVMAGEAATTLPL